MENLVKAYFDNLAKLFDEHTYNNSYNKWIGDSSNEVAMSEFLMVDKFRDYIKTVNLPHKECYKNSGKMALDMPDVTYCEGYIIVNNLPLPIDHAWIKFNDQYYDPTLYRDNANIKYYLTVEYNREEFMLYLIDKGKWGPFINFYFIEHNTY